MWKNNSLKDTK